MMATPDALKAEAEKSGCTLEIDRDDACYDIVLTAPHRKLFNGLGTHYDYSLYGNGHSVVEKIDWTKTRNDMRAIIQSGFEDCEDPDCDICEP